MAYIYSSHIMVALASAATVMAMNKSVLVKVVRNNQGGSQGQALINLYNKFESVSRNSFIKSGASTNCPPNRTRGSGHATGSGLR